MIDNLTDGFIFAIGIISYHIVILCLGWIWGYKSGRFVESKENEVKNSTEVKNEPRRTN